MHLSQLQISWRTEKPYHPVDLPSSLMLWLYYPTFNLLSISFGLACVLLYSLVYITLPHCIVQVNRNSWQSSCICLQRAGITRVCCPIELSFYIKCVQCRCPQKSVPHLSLFLNNIFFVFVRMFCYFFSKEMVYLSSSLCF